MGWRLGCRSSGHLTLPEGTVVHISSGFAALALALVIGKRVGFGKYAMEPNNIPLTILGAALLWFGWFGFNAGSALGANGLAAQAFVTTNIAAAAGALSWLLISWLHGKPSSLGFVSGAIAGLVAITPGCGYVTPMGALLIGAIGGCDLLCACFSSVSGKVWMRAWMHGQFMVWEGSGEHLRQVSLLLQR